MGSYLLIFRTISTLSFRNIWSYNLEKGFVLVNKVVSLITLNERFFIIIFSFIAIYLIKKFIEKNSKKLWLSYFLFVTLGYYFMIFSIIRQFIAIGILLLSLESIKERNLKKFLIYYIIGVSFHWTALVFILLYIVYPIKINIKYLVIINFGIIINFIFLDKIIIFLLNLLPKYEYMYKDIIIKGEGLKLLLLLYIIFFLGVLLKKLNIREEKEKIYFHMMALAVYLQSLSYGFSLFTRVVNYFSIIMIIFIPNLIVNQKDKSIKILSIISVIILTMYYYYKFLLCDSIGVLVPYKFF